MTFAFDSTVQYTGPQADFATITGSPIWGLSVQDVIAAAQQHGWTLQQSERLPTPYGLGPLLTHFTTRSGRSVIWIPSYGEVYGEDYVLHRNIEKVFWLLWQAGVKVLMVGGTSGIADWRKGEDAIKPGDIVLPWSFRTSPTQRGLPGTPFETFWPDYDVLLDAPFCPELAQPLAEKFREAVQRGQIRKVWTPQEARVALVVPDTLTFETDFDILMWLAISRMASEFHPNRPPIATLHGDCVNPILARHLGIHVLYYHMVANYAQGLSTDEDIAESIYDFYIKTFPQLALEVEFTLLETLPIPTGAYCRCKSAKNQAPAIFRQALTQPVG